MEIKGAHVYEKLQIIAHTGSGHSDLLASGSNKWMFEYSNGFGILLLAACPWS